MANAVQENSNVQTFTVHLRGMPFSCNEESVVEFLKIDREHIKQVDLVTNSDGRSAGEAYVVITNEESANTALEQHKQTFPNSTRWVEVFKSNEAKRLAGANALGQSWDGVVKIRGLSYDASPQDVQNFFQGLTIAPNGVFCPKNEKGQSSGEAFVQFMNYSCANNALKRHRQEKNGRYIEVFKGSNSELRRAMITDLKARHGQPQAQPSASNVVTPSPQFGGLVMSGGGPMRGQANQQRNHPYQQQPAQNGAVGGFANQEPVKQEPANPNNPFPHCVTMTGIPSGLSNQAVQDFFKPHRAIAVNMPPGANSGMVAFKTHEEAVAAMGKSGQPIMGVGIQLVLKSSAPVATNSWN